MEKCKSKPMVSDHAYATNLNNEIIDISYKQLKNSLNIFVYHRFWDDIWTL